MIKSEKLINNYVYDVVMRLPEDERKEVEKELKANIYDAVVDVEDYDQVEKVIKEFGHPSNLADQYRQNPKYLISPSDYENYIDVLRKFVPLAALFGIVIGFISGFAEYLSKTSDNFADTFSLIVGQTIEIGLSLSFASIVVITLGFVIWDRKYKKEYMEKWAPEQLMQKPDGKVKLFSRSEYIVEIVFNIIFSTFAILLISGAIPIPSNIQNYYISDYLDKGFIKLAVPFLGVIAIIEIIMSLLKIVYRRWNNPVFIIDVIGNLGRLVLTVILWTRRPIFSEKAKELVKNASWKGHETMSIFQQIADGNLDIIAYIIIAITVVATLINIIKAIVERNKYYETIEKE